MGPLRTKFENAAVRMRAGRADAHYARLAFSVDPERKLRAGRAGKAEIEAVHAALRFEVELDRFFLDAHPIIELEARRMDVGDRPWRHPNAATETV
jgi:hypothetical protein